MEFGNVTNLSLEFGENTFLSWFCEPDPSLTNIIGLVQTTGQCFSQMPRIFGDFKGSDIGFFENGRVWGISNVLLHFHRKESPGLVII